LRNYCVRGVKPNGTTYRWDPAPIDLSLFSDIGSLPSVDEFPPVG